MNLTIIPFKIHAAGLLLAAFALGSLSGCALYREDRCWVPDEQYDDVRQLYITTGSLDLVVKHLEEMEWKRCKVNEVRYRLEKEFDVLPEEKPRMSTVDPIEITPETEPAP